MPHCPICETEYDRGQTDCCSTCEWDLDLVLVDSETSLTLEQEAINSIVKKAIASAKKMWHKLTSLQSQQETKVISATDESKYKDLEETVEELKTRIGLFENFETEGQAQYVDVQKSINEQKQYLEQKIITENQKNYHTLEEQFNKSISNAQLELQRQFESLVNQREKHLTSQISELSDQLNKQLQEQSSKIESNKNQQTAYIPKIEKNESDLKEFKDFFQISKQINASEASITSDIYEGSEGNRNEPYSESKTSNELAKAWSNHQLVKQYNEDLHTLLARSIEVSETQKSISDRSAGSSQTVTLEEKSRGIYGIVAEENINYLVPSKSFRITDGNYKTVQALFECRGYQKGYSVAFQLLQPARVTSCSSDRQWQLQDRGILQF